MDQYPDERRQHAEKVLLAHSVAGFILQVLLLAHARGLAGCWYCAPVFTPEIVQTSLGVPETWRPQAFLTLGWPERPILGRRARDPLEDYFFTTQDLGEVHSR